MLGGGVLQSFTRCSPGALFRIKQKNQAIGTPIKSDASHSQINQKPESFSLGSKALSAFICVQSLFDCYLNDTVAKSHEMADSVKKTLPAL